MGGEDNKVLPCELRRKIREGVLISLYEVTGKRYVPAAVSNRHIHLSRREADILFGPGYELQVERPLVQPGQFAAKEKVSIVGPKGRISDIRVLGPLRPETQVEISVTDSYVLGIEQALRMSGDVGGSPGVRLTTARGQVDLPEGVIIAARHLHMSDDQAKALGLSNGQAVSLRKPGDRGVTLSQVIVRSGKGHELEVHLDTDEANAAMIANGDILEIVEG
jgi:putative phosphotransacetylase